MTMRQDGRGGGDDELFRTLYARYYGRMRRYFRRVFRVSDAEAQELSQDSFVRFYKAMGEYRGESPWALLETIARNVGYNHVRSLATIKRGAVRTESLDQADAAQAEPAVEQREPVDRLIEAERVERLRQAIRALPKGQSRCLQLWLDDVSYEEIARTLRISLEAVRSRIRDAKRSLRARLGDEGALPED